MIDGARLVPLIQPGACAGRRPVDRHADVDLLFELAWRTDNVAHSDCLLQRGLNLSQDYFPPALGHALGDMAVGERVTTAFEPGQLVSASESDNLFRGGCATFQCAAVPEAVHSARGGQILSEALHCGCQRY